MQRFFDNIFAYDDLLLPIGSDEITKRLQMWLNNPQCGHKEGEKFPFFGESTIMASPPIWLSCSDSQTVHYLLSFPVLRGGKPDPSWEPWLPLHQGKTISELYSLGTGKSALCIVYSV